MENAIPFSVKENLIPRYTDSSEGAQGTTLLPEGTHYTVGCASKPLSPAGIANLLRCWWTHSIFRDLLLGWGQRSWGASTPFPLVSQESCSGQYVPTHHVSRGPHGESRGKTTKEQKLQICVQGRFDNNSQGWGKWTLEHMNFYMSFPVEGVGFCMPYSPAPGIYLSFSPLALTGH